MHGPVVLDLAAGTAKHGRRVVEGKPSRASASMRLAGGLGGRLGRLPGGVPGLQRARHRGGGVGKDVDPDRLGRDAEVTRDDLARS